MAVAADAFVGSAHGGMGLSCVTCHTDLATLTEYPHADTLKPAECSTCHEASVCADCHTAHDIGTKPWAALRVAVHEDAARGRVPHLRDERLAREGRLDALVVAPPTPATVRYGRIVGGLALTVGVVLFLLILRAAFS